MEDSRFTGEEFEKCVKCDKKTNRYKMSMIGCIKIYLCDDHAKLIPYIRFNPGDGIYSSGTTMGLIDPDEKK